MSVGADLDRAVTSFFADEAPLGPSLVAIATALEAAAAGPAAVVRDNGDAFGAKVLERITAFANGNRLYMTSGLEALFEDTPPAGAKWLVCEPIPGDAGARSGIVVVGTKDDATEVLVLLPRLAKACGAMLARDRADAQAWKLTHGLNNLLAGAIANAEYAASLIGTFGAGTLPTDEERADIIHAIENTRDGVKKMVVTVKSLTGARRP